MSGTIKTSEIPVPEPEEKKKKPQTHEEKVAAHVGRIERTAVACIIGIMVGIVSYYLGGTPDVTGKQADAILAVFLMLAGIVIQRHIFILLKIGGGKLSAKDWFFQGFMTFAFWFISWTILLTTLHA
ncbi:MAG: hypothetical protein ABFC24_05540 [Methanoregulaceae archaeon]